MAQIACTQFKPNLCTGVMPIRDSPIQQTTKWQQMETSWWPQDKASTFTFPYKTRHTSHHTTMASRQFIRSLASAAPHVKPPVQLYGLDGTYATALYTAAAKDSSIEKTYQSVEKLNTAIKNDAKLNEILSNPSLSLGSRKEVIATIQSTLNIDATTVNLLNVLSENNRLGLFPQIAKQFSVLNSAHNGVVEATVVSAKPLDTKTIQRLTKAIQGSKFVGAGKSLKISNEINPDILGGLIVEVGDNTVDLSLSAKVTKLNKVLTEAI